MLCIETLKSSAFGRTLLNFPRKDDLLFSRSVCLFRSMSRRLTECISVFKSELGLFNVFVYLSLTAIDPSVHADGMAHFERSERGGRPAQWRRRQQRWSGMDHAHNDNR